MAQTEILRTTSQPPGFFARIALTVRGVWSGPLASTSPELAKWFGGGPTAAGVSITEESALTYSPIWSGVTMIADDIASLPLRLYKRLPNGGKDRFENHPLYRLLHDAPNAEMDAMVFRRTVQTHALLWGNGYAEIERDQLGRPAALWPLCPERVSVFRSGGAVKYRVVNHSGGEVVIDAEDMLHLIGPSHDGTVGASMVAKARESLALGLAAEKFGAALYGNGLAIGGVISYAGPRPPELSEKGFKEALEARHQGVERAHKLLALYNGAKYERMNIQPNDAQFLETRVFQIREAARWLKMPPHKLGDLADATFANVEQMDLAYFGSCLRPWLVLWEQQLSRKLIAKVERSIQFVEHDTHGFLAVDAAGRAALYAAEFTVGAIMPNEMRGYENRDPIEGGDQAFVQMNLIPLNLAQEYGRAQIDALKAKAQPQPQTVTVQQPPTADQINSVTAAVVRALVERDDAVQAQVTLRMTAETSLVEARAQTSSLEADKQAAAAAVAVNESRYASARALHETQLSESRSARDAALAQTAAQVAAATADLAVAMAEKGDVDVMLGVAEKARASAEQRVDDARRQEASLREAVSVLAQERDALAGQVAVSAAVAEELRVQTASAKAAELEARRLHLEAEGAKVLALAIASERGAAILLADERVYAASNERDASKARLAAATVAHRALIVDTVDRLLQREADRARKAQATPEKLRAWVDAFYPLHADVCRSTLRPVVVAWAACVGSGVDDLLAQLVRDHVSESTRSLRAVAEHEDPEAMAVDLERVLRRWETERAGTVADRLLQEGVARV